MRAYKLPNAGATKLTIGSTATTLESAIATASGQDFSLSNYNIKPNSIDIFIETEGIRFLDDGNTPTSSDGILLSSFSIAVAQLRDIDLTKLKFIREGGANAVISVRIGNTTLGAC